MSAPQARDGLRGFGFGAHETIRLLWQTPQGSTLGTATTTEKGTLTGASALTFTVPSSPAGSYALYAVGQSSGVQVSTPLTVTPSLMISSADGAPGTIVTVSGAGYAASEEVALLWNCSARACNASSSLGTAQADANGQFHDLSVTIPMTATAGTHSIGGRGEASTNFATALYRANYHAGTRQVATPGAARPASPPASAATATAPSSTTGQSIVAAATGCSTALPSVISGNTELTTSPCSVYTSSGTTVQTGATLSVDPGVSVLFYGGQLDIQGSLQASGTSSLPIVFSSANHNPRSGDWVGVRFESGTTGTLRYATIAYAGGCCYESSSALSAHGSSVNLDHITVSLSYDDGIDADGGSTVSLTNSSVTSNRGYGISTDNSVTLLVTSTTISGNDGEGVYAAGTATTLQSDVFTNNASYAVELGAPDATAAMVANTFSGNGLDGVYLDPGTLTGPATWSAANDGTIQLNGVVTVGKTTLTIAAGTTLMRSSGELDVQGTLTANGTAGQPIIMTSANRNPLPGNWSGLRFESGATGTLAYTTIDYAGGCCYSQSSALSVHSASVSLAYVTITMSSLDGLDADSGSSVSVTNSTISANAGNGISTDNTVTLSVSASTITGNGSEGIRAQGASTTIQNDVITDNASYAVELGAPNATAAMAANTFSGNALDGVYLDPGTLSKPATWSSANDGTIQLGGTITVGGTTLTVAAGTTTMSAYGELDVQGSLQVNGTSGQPAIFTSANHIPAPGDWTGIYFEAGASGTLNYAMVSYAGYEACCYTGGTLVAHSSSISLDHVTVTMGAGDGIDADGSSTVSLSSSSATLSVLNSTIDSSGNEGIYAAGPATIQTDVFTNNAGFPLELVSPNATANMAQNTFGGNAFDGLYLDGGTLSSPATWSAANDGPIQLGGTITVVGTTLTVSAGETVLVSYSGGLDVQGTLNANGTANQPIIFTSEQVTPQPGDWAGLLIEGGASATLDYSTLSDAGADACWNNCNLYTVAALTTLGGSLSLDNVTLTASRRRWARWQRRCEHQHQQQHHHQRLYCYQRQRLDSEHPQQHHRRG